MRNDLQPKIIEDNPIGNELNGFHKLVFCFWPLSSNSRVGFQDLVVDLLLALQNLRASRLLRSSGSGKNLLSDLSRLNAAVNPNALGLDRIKPLLRLSLTDQPADTLIGINFANSSEHRKYVDDVLEEELGSMHAGLRCFQDTNFRGVAGLDAAAQAFFEQCVEGGDPLFEDGWKGWPRDANQDGVLSWFGDTSNKLAAFSDSYG
ncbi:hypothetical protein FOMG_17734 [Fusarium oxysporum f. sp. melonis 26406]|uniref:Uncharacterized protein n=1 Tax=Fusarium oxysporum f. sp. melonis 26406 TaxID=1089452 RepID=W9Z2J3_FUSOX|nr:hypothetical protein FOMG_17734 [Fusarium oxysporum f. sp. melonis 26406]